MAMSSSLFIVLWAFVSSAVFAHEVSQTQRLIDDGDWVIDDMILPINIFSEKSEITPNTLRWPNKTVPYTISDSLNATARKIIRDTMDGISRRTCLIFREKTAGDVNFIELTAERQNSVTLPCDSPVGHRNGRKRLILADKVCFQGPVLEHELCHAIGIFHEHLRPDRDNFVDINWNNIQEIAKPYFAYKIPKHTMSDFGLPYDFNSVMHYPNNRYAIDPNVPTISKKGCPSCPLGGAKTGLSPLDVERINRMYKCPKK